MTVDGLEEADISQVIDPPLTRHLFPRPKIVIMKKSLLVLVGFVLLLPTVYCVAAGALARSSGAGLAFGVWMIIGLPTMLGAISAFTKANKLFQEDDQKARLSGKTYPPVDYPAVAAEPPSDAKVRMMAAMEHAIQAMPKKPTGSAFGKRSS